MSGATSTLLQDALEPRALNVEGGAAPEWIELIPAGATVAGVDGRRWANPDPQRVISLTLAGNRPLPLDWEHATEERAPKGLEAPAAGWVESLELRDGAIWGRVDWTERGRNQVARREYRFVSPVFTHAAAEPKPIGRLVSVALTNTPNLTLRALNRAAEAHTQETDLDLKQQLREALGLSADATDDAIVTAVKESKAANKTAAVDLTSYAPRSELTALNTRAETAEAALKARDAADRDAKIETALNAAQTEGKITPASRPEYLAMCKVEGGLEKFERLAVTLPVLTGAQVVAASKKVDETAGGLTDEQKAVCRALGQSEADFAKSLKEA